MSKEKLKPCPFCDEKEEIEISRWVGMKKWDVECLICGGSTGSYATKKRAIKAWDRRVK